MTKYFVIAVVGILAFLSTNFSSAVEVPKDKNIDYANTKRAYFAGGCFWGAFNL